MIFILNKADQFISFPGSGFISRISRATVSLRRAEV